MPSKYTAIGLLLTVVSLLVAFYPEGKVERIKLDQEKISGKYAITSIGEQDVYFGVEFVSPPKLEITGGFDNPEGFRVIEQRRDGFKFVIGGAFTSGTELSWHATGHVKIAHK